MGEAGGRERGYQWKQDWMGTEGWTKGRLWKLPGRNVCLHPLFILSFLPSLPSTNSHIFTETMGPELWIQKQD